MSATSEEIRTGIAANLSTLRGVQVSAYALSNPTPPAVHVLRGEVTYDAAMQGGAHWWTMRVQGFVGMVNDIAAQQLLDQWLSPDGDLSVKQAIESDPTLAGTVDDLHVTNATGEQVFTRDQGGQVLGSEWTVRVLL